ncbi:hypothetical protein PFISCL1PPCAC_5679 [Pristionchus fissidentatus]|uniref:C3H1-type domain-containing protein n=1 Tax=Pristionchus fissidentatus TaxID=1538716 RepID=A0AAV5V7Y9_9BILA|nr:hypothetical protein PFISCL1PPCAC_5679 [Pristionchus fissidentatus]
MEVIGPQDDPQEKEDGELDSDQEDGFAGRSSASPNQHEEAIDKLLASCNSVADEVSTEKASLDLGTRYRAKSKSKERSVPVSYRKRVNDRQEERISRTERSDRSRNKQRAPSNRRNSHNRKRSKQNKQTSRDISREKMEVAPLVGVPLKKSNEMVVTTVDEREKERERQIVSSPTDKADELSASMRESMAIKKKKLMESTEFEKRKEKLNEDERILAEKKSKLAKSERAVIAKRGYINDMCKRRDDYVRRVQRLIEDIESEMIEEENMRREMDEMRREVNEEEMKWNKESNQIASEQLKAMMSIEQEEGDDMSMIEVEEVVSDEKEEEEGRDEYEEIEEDEQEEHIGENQQQPQAIKSNSIDEHELEALRTMLLRQIQGSRERSEESDSNQVNEMEEEGPIGDQIDEIEDAEMEQEPVEMEEETKEEISIGIEGDDPSSTLCPWDLNGTCKDDDCIYMHDRDSSSRLGYSQEIAT